MTTYRKLNFADVKDSAPDFGMGETLTARFARQELGAERIGLAHYQLQPGARLGFGHSHGESEEAYVVIGGSGRFKVGEEIFPVVVKDVVYCPADSMREWEAGADGMEMLAFGGHAEGEASHMDQEFWKD